MAVRAFVTFEHVCKTYTVGEVSIEALKDASFTIDEGEICVIVGASGAGKTTLIKLLMRLYDPTSGQILMNGRDIREYDLDAYREKIGVVFQFYKLLPNMTALENVQIASQLCRQPLPAEQVLRGVGLGERMQNFPAQLSGGEQQRVAIARALAKNPKLLLCDEPTGALDYNTGKQILQLLQKQSRENGMTVVIITHNSALTGMADRVIRVKSGTIQSVSRNANPTPVERIEW